ncbi:MAG: hypothetical protein JST41_07665 [Bacteroidetes bacterium]|jgi:hypothetical protein|nr:hypothetical protein [Bacteroidota bacterium]MBX7129270.1 hypothetical protein [Flavobacteriales bacterium]MCC6654610.1 hypothetical protein [Flavobacteriales bacterium]HMU15071.1 hypothetical protein [Flavobacteriales bacterium]HMW95773.1 hypothetical protein [Flavobacteriales bacterium]
MRKWTPVLIENVEKKRTENWLASSELFALPGTKKLVEAEDHFGIVRVYVSEHPIERPPVKSSDSTTRGRR